MPAQPSPAPPPTTRLTALQLAQACLRAILSDQRSSQEAIDAANCLVKVLTPRTRVRKT